MEKFLRDAKEFQSLSREFPGCEWTLVTNLQGEGFLKRRIARQNYEQEFLTWDFHICFSESYEVPVLWFNAGRQDGSLLKIDQVWSNVMESFKDSIMKDPWKSLTQAEHPYLHTPWFQIHPCKTAEMLKVLQPNVVERNMIIPWLSIYGPVMGIDIPLELLKRIESPPV